MSLHHLKDRPHGNPRKLPWRAVVARKGQKPLAKQFATREEASIWEAELKKQERLRDAPEYKQSQELKALRQRTIRDLIFDYIKSHPEMNTSDVLSLNQFARENICAKSVLDFSRQDVFRWIEKRKNETWKSPGSNGDAKPITPRTVRRQANIIQRVFQYTIDHRDGFSSLPNPFRGVEIQGSTGGRRERTLEGDELQRILQNCKFCRGENKLYLPLGVLLAIETGMRRQEIFNLTWQDIDIENRRIMIRKSKTDKKTGNRNGTTIVLPKAAMSLLKSLVLIKRGFDEGVEGLSLPQFPKDDGDRIFPMTGEAFTQAFTDVLKRAGIKNLTFHDLRREANSRFIRAGLTVQEQNLMLRHADKSMNAIYTGRSFLLNGIQRKLDQFVSDTATATVDRELQTLTIEIALPAYETEA